MKIRFEPMDHNANLNISVEEGKNMKHPEIKGPIRQVLTRRLVYDRERGIHTITSSVSCKAGDAYSRAWLRRLRKFAMYNDLSIAH